MKNEIIGYTAGVFDMFHIGHLKLLMNAKGMCDRLIVGVTTDECAMYKNKKPVIPFDERIEIVRNIKCVDAAVPQENMDKTLMCKKLGVSYLFVGDDWYDTDKWKKYEDEKTGVAEAVSGCKVIYFPYTKGVSSTILKKKISDTNSK